MRSFHLPGRSPVYARHAMCATSHPLATATAVDVLKSGGNAIDAAIAATAVMCVVEHPMTGIGGDFFTMIAKPGGELVALNASGRAPAAATAEHYADLGIAEVEATSPHAVTVPGAIDGWSTIIADHGTKPLGELLQPAIGYARDGFPVAPRVHFDWICSVPKLALNEGGREHLLFDGQAPQVGQVVRMPALADTLSSVAEGGRDAFYTGPVGADIVGELQRLGGLHTLEDFAAQRSNYVQPISCDYKGLTLHELPPNTHGVVALIVLKLLERLGTVADDPLDPRRFHAMVETARHAYAVRDAFVADPEMVDVPVEHMLSDTVIDELAGRIDLNRRTHDLGPTPQPAGSDTVYLSVVDANGMAVSVINSLFSDFGSGIVAPKSGVVLHNRGMGFRFGPGHPNSIGPRKRPLHTLVPAIATEAGELAMSFGVMGGQFQPLGHAYVITNMRDFGMDPQEALDCPRAFFEGETVMIEETVPMAARTALADMGHDVAVREVPWGGGQIVQVDRERGVLIGASDPRKDGCALGY